MSQVAKVKAVYVALDAADWQKIDAIDWTPERKGFLADLKAGNDIKNRYERIDDGINQQLKRLGVPYRIHQQLYDRAQALARFTIEKPA